MAKDTKVTIRISEEKKNSGKITVMLTERV